jgi:gliding motility-associated-like protein
LKTLKLILLFIWLPIVGFGQAAVHLNCIKTLLNGDVECYWNVPSNACPATCFVSYDVYVSSTGKGGVYTLLTSITNAAATSCTHIGANGNNNQNLYYFVQTICNCGAGNITVNSDTAGNASLAIPIINYITVNGNSVLMNWQPSTSSQTYAYQIYYVDNSGYHALDTVQGLYNVNYTSTAYNTNTQSVTFSIASIDSCGTTGLFNSTTPQHTLLLNASVDRCNQSVNLNWNAYINWSNGVSKYDVFLKLNHDTFKVIKSLTPLVLSTILTGFKDGDTLQFYIQASELSSTFISTSNVIKIVMNIVQPPLFGLMQTCTVDSNKNVLLEFVLDAAADIKAYSIYRCTDNINYSLLATMPITLPLTNNAILYRDKEADVHHQSYYYKIFSVDSCGGLHKGNQSNSVLLTGNLTAYNTVELNWNNFAIDTGLIVQYTILRSVNQGASFTYVATLLPNQPMIYGDDIHPLYASQDSIIYKIMVDYTFNHSLLRRRNTSFSNDLVIHPNSEIFIPNTIFPKGKNNVFKPIITFPDILNYNLIIFNRIGEKIFISNTYNDGWDGTKAGTEVPQGNYTYQITFDKPNGVKFVKQGNVVVVY